MRRPINVIPAAKYMTSLNPQICAIAPPKSGPMTMESESTEFNMPTDVVLSSLVLVKNNKEPTYMNE